jgi:PTH2 family peptidyl-tRNA hydrolase
MRKDLNCRKGKMCAQAAHASMKVLLDAFATMLYGPSCIWQLEDGPAVDDEVIWKRLQLDYKPDTPLDQWINGKFAKIVVGVDSLDELMDVYWKAKEAGLLAALIEDEGRTEFHGEKTITCAAIGPAWPEDLDPITGGLKLL